ncbi:Ribokinase-like protein, partial [Jaminaea rosea]
MAANEAEPQRLLSVQSHVASGYVGNRSATFPLQLLGWDVDVINTVQFSNHTGYGRFRGSRFDEAHIRSLFSGLEENGLLKQSRLLSGYMPSPGVVHALRDAVERIRGVNPGLVYLCDPVMGDMGRGMYVDPNVLPAYRAVLPLASIVTPNQFEAQVLAEREIRDLPSLLEVLARIHDQGVEHVIITSVELPKEDLERMGVARRARLMDGETEVGSMVCVGSSRPTRASAEDTPLRPWFIEFPEIPGYFSGVGDLFAALTLGRYDEAQAGEVTPIARAAELAIASVQGVLARTTAA